MSAPAAPHLYRQALDHHEAGRLEEALALYQRLLAENPADGEWLAQAGLAACQTGQTAQGCAWLERAVELAPDQIGVWLNLATVRYALGQGAASLAAADQALARLPGPGEERATALGARGRALIALGHLDAALAAYEQAAAQAPGQPDYARAVALLQVQRQGPEAALPALERALALVPDGIETEVSGGVEIGALAGIGALGADFVSVGRITHSAKSADFSMLLKETVAP